MTHNTLLLNLLALEFNTIKRLGAKLHNFDHCLMCR